MRNINSESKRLNFALPRGLRTLKPWNWLVILVAVPLLLTAVLWVTAPQLGQAQGAVPAKPTGLTATAGGQQVALTWDDPSDSSITGYEYIQAQAAKLTAFDGADDDRFGYSVAVDGDTVVVGAYRDDDKGVDSGAAYVYIRQSGTWSQVAKLTALDGADGDRFGYSVAVDGDTVVVGAYWDEAYSGSAYLFTKPDTGWATATETAKLTAFDGASGDYFGNSVSVDEDTVVVGAYWDDDNGLDSGSAYLFTKPDTGWITATETAKLTAYDGAQQDYFGYSVAVDGDTVVVGAYRDDDKGSNSGSAYVLTKPDTGWVTATGTIKLTAYDGAQNDYFGYSVAVDGDTVVVGASRDDDHGSNSGSAYVLTKPATGWVTTNTAAKLTAYDGASDDRFGVSVAVDGDTVAVGANWDDDKGSKSGSAYLFTKPAGGWVTATDTAKLTASDGVSDDWFGHSVAVDGDTVVAGALLDDDKGSDSGSAYVYQVSDWTDIPSSGSGETNATSYAVTGLTNNREYDFRIRAANASGTGVASDAVTVTTPNTAPTAVDDTANTLENSSVDINVVANDIDPDPGTTLSVTAVTSPSSGTVVIKSGSTTTVTYTPDTGFNGADSFDYTLSDGTDTDTGTVTVLVGPSPVKPTGLTAGAGDSQAALTWDDPSNSSITGYEYLLHTQAAKLTTSDGAADDEFGWSVSVDGNTAVVGALMENGGQGKAYVYIRQSGAWSQVAKLTASDGAANDQFGVSVAVNGDTVVVGAHQDDDNNINSGSAYVFTKPANGWADATETAKLTASDGTVGSRFGGSVSVDMDTVAVGARLEDDNNIDSGSAYVFTKPGTGWAGGTETAKLTASDGAVNDQFGRSVAVDGDTVVVAAHGDDDNGADAGSAYVFTKPNTGGWTDATETAKLTASDGAGGDYFGISIAVDGDTVVVGAYLDDTSSADTGSAYVFTKPNTGWADATETAKLTASDWGSGDYFGLSVAVEGNTVVVGAAQDDDNGYNSGSAYVFKKPADGWVTATETAKLTASDGAADDNFGWLVALDGGTVMAGASLDDDNGTDSGSAYVYEVSDWTAVPSSAAGETNATSYTVTGLTNDLEYNFRIRAANGVGASPASDAVTVTPTS